MITVEQFIASELDRPDTGPLPCCRLFDRWVASVQGYSILERYGYDYRTQEDADRIRAKHGNMVFAMLHLAELDGGIEVDPPAAGDVGIIVHAGQAIAAVHAGDIWFSRSERGFIGASVAITRLIKAWRPRLA